MLDSWSFSYLLSQVLSNTSSVPAPAEPEVCISDLKLRLLITAEYEVKGRLRNVNHLEVVVEKLHGLMNSQDALEKLRGLNMSAQANNFEYLVPPSSWEPLNEIRSLARLIDGGQKSVTVRPTKLPEQSGSPWSRMHSQFKSLVSTNVPGAVSIDPLSIGNLVDKAIDSGKQAGYLGRSDSTVVVDMCVQTICTRCFVFRTYGN